MDKQVRINLETSEQAVLRAAATIYAAYVQCGATEHHTEDELIRLAVETAVKMARVTDDRVASDSELHEGNGLPKLRSPQVIQPRGR